ncbi:MAG TPA: hypothetical protein VJ810_14610 [Blastocatellia bacterium]|nr:hypothetical protein [Blastocatellia bacterium]
MSKWRNKAAVTKVRPWEKNIANRALRIAHCLAGMSSLRIFSPANQCAMRNARLAMFFSTVRQLTAQGCRIYYSKTMIAG